ncbi:MAG: hypothetical protein ACU0BS_05155 [Hasllibacter sp.]
MPSLSGNAQAKVVALRGPITRVLVIGGIGTWPGDGSRIPDADHVHFAEPETIGPDLILEARPDLVISCLVGPGWDAVEVAAALSRAGYTGRYRALTPNLPDVGLVRREVRRAARDVDFDVILVSNDVSATA